jgi:ribosomal protein L7Ae-like RNA K-turn-binding protein
MGKKDPAKALRLIGLCRRAGHLVAGMDVTLKALYNGSARLLILAQDISEGSRQKALRAAVAAGVPICSLADRHELGRGIGRRQCVIVAITDAGLAAAILAACGATSGEAGGNSEFI